LIGVAALFALAGCAEQGPALVPATPAMQKMSVYLVKMDDREFFSGLTEPMHDALAREGLRPASDAEREKADAWIKIIPASDLIVTIRLIVFGKVIKEQDVSCRNGFSLDNSEWARCIAAKAAYLLVDQPSLRALAYERYGSPASTPPAGGSRGAPRILGGQ
jgi:hypothetical protein